MNLRLSRLDEQQRRRYAAVESAKLGHGGDRSVSRITGLHVDTIRRGREELAASLEDRPADRVQLPGGGRPALEKKPPRPSVIFGGEGRVGEGQVAGPPDRVALAHRLYERPGGRLGAFALFLSRCDGVMGVFREARRSALRPSTACCGL